MFENRSAHSGCKHEFLPLSEYREVFAAVASEEEIRQFDESLALGNKIVPIKLLRRYADQLDI